MKDEGAFHVLHVIEYKVGEEIFSKTQLNIIHHTYITLSSRK